MAKINEVKFRLDTREITKSLNKAASALKTAIEAFKELEDASLKIYPDDDE